LSGLYLRKDRYYNKENSSVKEGFMIQFESFMKKEQVEKRIDVGVRIKQWALLFWAFARGEVIDSSLSMGRRMQNVVLYVLANKVFLKRELTKNDVRDSEAYGRAYAYGYLKWIPELGELKVTKNGLDFIDFNICFRRRLSCYFLQNASRKTNYCLADYRPTQASKAIPISA